MGRFIIEILAIDLHTTEQRQNVSTMTLLTKPVESNENAVELIFRQDSVAIENKNRIKALI